MSRYFWLFNNNSLIPNPTHHPSPTILLLHSTHIFLQFIKIMETLFGFWTFMYSILAWDTLTRTTEAQNSNGFNLPMDEIRRGLWYDIHHKPFIFEGIIFNLINFSLWTQFNYILINWSVIFKHVDVVIYMLWIYIYKIFTASWYFSVFLKKLP